MTRSDAGAKPREGCDSVAWEIADQVRDEGKGGALSVAVLFLVFMPCAGTPKPNWVGRGGRADMAGKRPLCA